jgi:hypothetical protein
MPFCVLLRGSRNGERIVTDVEMLELRLPSRRPTVWRAPVNVERYRPRRERQDGLTVAWIVSAIAPASTSTGWARS